MAEIINWTGQVIALPRAQLADMAGREELRRTGIYILVGLVGDREQIYIGEGDDVFDRLKAHDRDPSKDFWTRAVTVTSKDFNLTKSHGRFLECRLIGLAQSADRVVVSNGTSPDTKPLPEPDVADMEYFLDQIELVLPVLGFDFLREQAKPDAESVTDDLLTLTMTDAGAEAHAQERDGVFIVMKGSTARIKTAPSLDNNIKVRDELVASKRLIPKDDHLFEFASDVEFSSPSSAATVVAGGNRNGRITWQLPDGRTYSDWKTQQIEAAERNSASSDLNRR